MKEKNAVLEDMVVYNSEYHSFCRCLTEIIEETLKNACLQYENRIDKMKIEEEITRHHSDLIYSENLQKQKDIFQSKLEQLVLENQALRNDIDNLRNRLE